jgi:SAM-dependent methyltransferase
MNCPCDASGDELIQYFTYGETDFHLCGNCGCVFRERFPSPSELDDIYRQAYAEENICEANTNQESGDYAAQSYAQHLMSQVVLSGDRLLDYGAGSGALLDELRKLGLVADGLEFSENARDYCLSNRGFSLKADLHEVPDGYYQVISMIEVIEHLTDLSGTLKEIFRVLAPGGRLFVTTPSRTGLRARIEKGHWHEAQKKFHLFLFDLKSMDFHLKRAGFIDVKRNKYGPLQKAGWKFAIYSRTIQSIGLSGTLCVLARK